MTRSGARIAETRTASTCPTEHATRGKLGAPRGAFFVPVCGALCCYVYQTDIRVQGARDLAAASRTRGLSAIAGSVGSTPHRTPIYPHYVKPYEFILV